MPYLHQQLSQGEPVALTSGRQGPINICSGVPITVRQLAEQIADQYGRRDLLKFGARPDNLFDPPCVVGAREIAERHSHT